MPIKYIIMKCAILVSFLLLSQFALAKLPESDSHLAKIALKNDSGIQKEIIKQMVIPGLNIYFISPALSFIENDGQVIDQNKKLRHYIPFKIYADNGQGVFIGIGKLEYQFSKLIIPYTGSRANSTENMQSPPQTYDMYRIGVELIGANTNAVFIKEPQESYFERCITTQTLGSLLCANSYKKDELSGIYQMCAPNEHGQLYLYLVDI